MKRVLSLCLLCFTYATLTAQSVNVANAIKESTGGTTNKTTGDGDRLPIFNFNPQGPFFAHSYNSVADSGYYFGTNIFNHQAFAEKYAISGADSSVKLVAIAVLFSGKYDTASHMTINLKMWDKTGRQPFTGKSNVYYDGKPGSVMASAQYPLDSLDIPTGVASQGTVRVLVIQSGSVSDTFFVGYGINYKFNALAGDTIGLTSTDLGIRNNKAYYVSGSDTIITSQNMVQYEDGTWHDIAYEENKLVNLSFAPVVDVKWTSTGVNSFSKNGVKFFGHYPNPANDVMNIKLALEAQSKVGINIMDMSGRVIKTIREDVLTSGKHIIPVSIQDLPAGNYIYTIKTNKGTIGSKLNIIR